jgi:hypothetical protein
MAFLRRNAKRRPSMSPRWFIRCDLDHEAPPKVESESAVSRAVYIIHNVNSFGNSPAIKEDIHGSY